MHPLVGIGLVFLAAIAWSVTILTMLIVLVKARRRPPAHGRRAVQSTEIQSSDERQIQGP
ncbi:hypothetical protein [Pseudarthrobacter sp. NKDBFgelt]|uniref:hypothetical protein n=1 Tax=Pseudarthrobacter sp. NKDBFgelt TaxID=3384443 RepID=UPI00168C02F8|nr:hypothetical protein [Arthrobacter sp. S13_S34]